MKRKVTAGMLHMIRSCGVSLKHKDSGFDVGFSFLPSGIDLDTLISKNN